MLVSAPASALAIGSWLALVPAAAFCLAILKRVAAEEESLHANLAAYNDYMRQVRGRLFPRIAVPVHIGFRSQRGALQAITLAAAFPKRPTE
jgi:hypothetical protein